jgi:sec-independent protein translocase protein TatA
MPCCRPRRSGTTSVFTAAFFDFSLTVKGGTMFEGLFQPVHLLLIVGIALLCFGPSKFADLGKGLGDSIRNFKSALKQSDVTSESVVSEDKSKPDTKETP